MFRKVHIRLTLLFAAVCSAILAVMSASYILLSIRSIYGSALSRLESDTAAFTSTISYNKVISDDWLSSIQRNYDYVFFLYDNSKPMLFTINKRTQEDMELIGELKEKYAARLDEVKDTWSVKNGVFTCRLSGKRYHAALINIPGENGCTELYLLDSLNRQRDQLRSLLIHFGAVIIITSAALLAFAWFFTKILLKPIQRSHEQQAHFIAAASHEIRNPVNTIISALDAMDECQGSQRDEFAEIARREGKRLTLLTEDLLNLARSDNGSFITEMKATELDTVIIDCYEAFLAPAREKAIKLDVSLPDNAPPPAMADTERIKQVVSILLNNAVSYTLENGSISLAYSFDKSYHTITVSDSGPGISEEDKKHIFERFYRADRARESRSHFGLGLSIAKEITDLHHGSITVSDSSCGGAEFTISLPTIQPSQEKIRKRSIKHE